MARLPRELFAGYNPFAICNYPQVDEITYWNLPELFGKPIAKLFLQVRGLVFQDGRRPRQVSHYSELADSEGVFWTETSGLVIHATPFGNVDPDPAQWEITTREQIFARAALPGVSPPQRVNTGVRRQRLPLSSTGEVPATHGHHWILEGNTIRWANGVEWISVSGGTLRTPPGGRNCRATTSCGETRSPIAESVASVARCSTAR